jgi:hypothetical protein
MSPSVLYISSVGTGLARAAAGPRSPVKCRKKFENLAEKISRRPDSEWTTTPARAKPQDAATDCKITYVSYTDSLKHSIDQLLDCQLYRHHKLRYFSTDRILSQFNPDITPCLINIHWAYRKRMKVLLKCGRLCHCELNVHFSTVVVVVWGEPLLFVVINST